MKIQHTPNIIKGIVEKVDEAIYAEYGFHVFFDKGSYSVVNKNLTLKGKSITQKGERYPLIWLAMPFVEKRGKHPDIFSDVNLTLIIAAQTNPNYSNDERDEKVFDPILLPIYKELMIQLSKSKILGMPNMLLSEHEFTAFYYWGEQDGNGNSTANYFNDFIDAIEIRNLKLKIKQQIC